MKYFATILTLMLSCTFNVIAGPPSTVDNIHVDQFGYLPEGQKIAVISRAQTGYNAPESYNPGTSFEVRRWSDDVVVFTGPITAWNGGATHAQSGDRAWWFDFSSVTAEGSYYVYDPTNSVGSYEFEIKPDVYVDVLKHAMRTFYYQRCGVAKTAPYAETGWTDAVSFAGTEQDLDCRLYSNPVPGTSQDLSGGWFDAGDYNKYVNFTWGTLIDLLTAYEENPTIWTDDYNIPESGNGIPDVLDEVKFELDWILKMQQPDGSVLSIVGRPDAVPSGTTSPPSAASHVRRYGPANTSAALTTAGVLSLAAIQFNSIGQTTYANTLQTAAINAWNWADANPNVTWSNSGNIRAGEQETDNYGRLSRKVAAACFLYKLTGNTTYRTYFDANYDQIHLIQWPYAYPFEDTQQDVLLYYTTIAGATPAVSTDILNTYAAQIETNNADNLPNFLNETDAYRAYLDNNNYTWGSNSTKGRQGGMFYNMLEYGLDQNDSTNYKNAASGFVHYIHGVNPLNILYLSNMYNYGGDNCVNEFYHSWFYDGSALWDRVGTSTYGPAPGFLPGGPNPNYDTGENITPPEGQPHQKSYLDWNTTWPENSWEVTENGIYYQANYIKLLSKFVKLGSNCTTPNLGANQSICGVGSINLNSGLATDGITTFEWFRNAISQGAPSTTANTFNATQDGNWSVQVDSASCSESDVMTITADIGTVNLGADFDLCSPSVDTLDAGVNGTGFNYAWTKDASGFGGNTQKVAVSEAGTYEVTVSASGCPNVNDQIIVTSSVPVADHDTICSAGTANLSVTGTGPFDWFDMQTGGTNLNTGSSYSPSIASNTTYWVEAGGGAAQYTRGPAGPGAGPWNITDFNNSDKQLLISPLTDLTLVELDVWSNGAIDVTINVDVDGGANVGSNTVSVPGAGQHTIPLNIALSNGTTYRIDAEGTSGGPLQFKNASGIHSYPETEPGIFTLTNTEGWNADWSTFYNITVSVGTSCDRVPVYAIIDAGHPSCGACNTPGTASISPSSPPAQCGGSVLLTASETGTPPGGGFEYEFFRGAVSVQGPGSSNTYSATQSGSYTVEVTDPADAATCNATSSAVNVTIDQNPTTSNAGPDQSVCSASATLAGNNPATGTGMWSLVSGAGTITAPSNRNSGVTALGIGANTFRWTISNGSCSPSTDDVIITRDDAPTAANAGPDDTYCAASYTLGANTPSVGTGTWTLMTGSASFGAVNDPSSTVTIPVGTTATLRWTISNGSCVDETDDVDIMHSCPTGVSGSGSSDLNVYPNPSTSSFTISISNGASQFSYSITDVQGRVIESGSVNGSSTELGGNLVSGVYILNVDGFKSVLLTKTD